MTINADRIDDLMIFLEVVEAGGFSAASRRTGRSTSLLSRRIQILERTLGISLFVRDSRRCAVTPVGQRLVEHAMRIRSEAQTAFSFAADNSEMPMGVLRVSCPLAYATWVVGPVAIDLAVQHPQLQLSVSTYSGRPPDREHAADIVIFPSIGGLKDANVVARKIADNDYVLVAAPAMAQRYRQCASPQDFNGMPAIGWTFHDSPGTWVFQDRTGQQEVIHVDVRFLADSLSLINEAALQGLGMAQLPLIMCRKHLADGTLCRVLDGWAPPPMGMYAMYPTRKSLTPGGRLFIDSLSGSYRDPP